jgi:hypothetical protein
MPIYSVMFQMMKMSEVAAAVAVTEKWWQYRQYQYSYVEYVHALYVQNNSQSGQKLRIREQKMSAMNQFIFYICLHEVVKHSIFLMWSFT